MSERPDLGHVAKNPFLLNLIILHYGFTGSIPKSQKEIFETYFSRNIGYARNTSRYRNITDNALYEICERIAICMFNSPTVTLEISRNELRKTINDARLDDAVDFLIRSKIGRISNENDLFSFSHRRFNEFFLVRNIETGKIEVPLDAIQSDTKWRDALVLYAEIASDIEAHKLAAHAWQYAERLRELSHISDWNGFVKSRNALRFIIDGFRNRPWILPMRQEIADLIKFKVWDDGELIEKRTVIEAITILDSEQALPIIERVFKRYPGWLSEGAATATRYLSEVETPLALEFYYHAVRRPGLESLIEAKRLAATLSISEATRYISTWLNFYRYDFWKTLSFVLIFQLIGLIYIGKLALFVPLIFISFFFSFSFLNVLGIAWIEFLQKRMKREEPPPNFLMLGGFGGTYLIENIPAYLKFGLSMMLFLMLSLGVTYNIPALEDSFQHDAPRNEIANSLRSFWQTAENLELKAAILVAWIVALLPIYPPPYMLMRRHGWAVLKRLTWLFLGIACAITLAILYFDSSIIKFALTIIAATSAIFVTCVLLFGLGNIVRDFFLLRQAKKQFDGTRSNIAERFRKFNTPYYRLKYVNSLAELALPYKDRLAESNNVWPEVARPQMLNDIAASELARLDAQWRGLD